MVEIDEEIAAVWEVILNGRNQWLADKTYSYDLTHANIKTEFENPNREPEDIAFCTILKNRVFHGGILAKGSGMIKNGENGKGIASRWYPKTLRDRILAINYVKDKIKFISGDAFQILEQNLTIPMKTTLHFEKNDRMSCLKTLDHIIRRAVKRARQNGTKLNGSKNFLLKCHFMLYFAPSMKQNNHIRHHHILPKG